MKDNETFIKRAIYPLLFDRSRNLYEINLREFNALVNMTVSELKEWLQSDDSTGSGWGMDSGSGETIDLQR